MRKQLDGDGQQDNAEKLLQHVDCAGTEETVYFFGDFENNINPDDIEYYCQNNVNVMVLRADGQQSG